MIFKFYIPEVCNGVYLLLDLFTEGYVSYRFGTGGLRAL